MAEMNKINDIPEAVCIGFFCHDIYKHGYILGGTASYCSLMLQQLGKQTAVITSVGDDFLFANKFQEAGIIVHNKKADQTTIFENVYNENDERTQYIHGRAYTLNDQDIPENWKQTSLVKLCLIADEAAPSLLTSFPNAMIGATIQGWLRQWDEHGQISPKEMDWEILKSVDVVLFSKDDLIGFEDKLSIITNLVDVAVMTDGRKGATVFHQNESYHFPAFPVKEIDPTGAGDFFASAFLYHYSVHKDIALATAYAHSAASFVVEGVGVHMPSKKDIEQRFINYVNTFSIESMA